MYVSVPGGTNAGWRTLREKPQDWKCPICRDDQPGYRKNCFTCSTERP